MSPCIAIVTIPLKTLCTLVYRIHRAIGPLVSWSLNGPGPGYGGHVGGRSNQFMDTLTLISWGLSLAPFTTSSRHRTFSSEMPRLPTVVTQLIALTTSFRALVAFHTGLSPSFVPFETLFPFP